MPNINITDSRNRDAVVKAEPISTREFVNYVGPKGGRALTRKILKSTVDHDYDNLLKAAGSAQAVGQALIDGDPEVDMEIFGQFLWNISKVYVNKAEDVVYSIEQNEIVRDTKGKQVKKRPRERAQANVDGEIPLTWTGRAIKKNDAIRRFVFASKLQIVHINGLTYDFLFGIASELAESESMMMIGGGAGGKEPLVFRRGSVPYRGFLEGRVDGEKYILLLHLSNTELKQPSNSKTKMKPDAAVQVVSKDVSPDGVSDDGTLRIPTAVVDA